MSFLSKDSDHAEQPGRYDPQKTNIKCVVVGDAMVGKTSLARRLASLGYIPDYDPTTFDNYAVTTTVDGISYVISIFDTAGQEEFGHLRTLSYVNCDVFLLCFSVAAPESLDNAQEKWMNEIRKYSPNAPIILVGTQIDRRDDVMVVSSKIGPALLAPSSKDSCLASKIRPANSSLPKEMNTSMHSHLPKIGEMTFIATKEGLNTSDTIDVECYVECSSVTEAGIRKLTEEVVENGRRYFEDDDKSDCHCACAIM